MYDPTNGRMLSVDNFVQDPYSTQGYNRYSYALNNPLKYTDPDGENPIAMLIGAVIGVTINGISNLINDQPFFQGAGKAAIIGALGGLLAPIGGGTFIANVAWGAGQGALLGGLGAAMSGGDIGKGMLYGAVIGAAFATVTSGIESIGNAKDGFGFGTNEGRLKQFIKHEDKWDKLSSFMEKRYGISSKIEFSEAFDDLNMNRLDDELVYGAADFDNNRILLAREAYENSSLFKTTVVHEYAHLKFDFDNLGEYIGGDNHYNGLFNEFRNSGRMHINMRKAYSFLNNKQFSVLKSLYSTHSGTSPLFHAIPHRFNTSISLFKFI